MRVAVITAFLALLASPALGQSWQEYRYSDLGFAASFPAPPTVTDAPAKAPDGASVTQKVISASANGSVFRVTVTDYSASSLADEAAIAKAADALHSQGDVLVDIPARVNRNYGRQLSIAGKDGNRTVAAIFFVDHKLYEIEGVARPAATADATRFQQSLNFFGGFGGFRRGRNFPSRP